MEPTWYTVSIVCPACGKENSLTGSIEAFEEVDCSSCHHKLGNWGDLIMESEEDRSTSIKSPTLEAKLNTR